MDYWFCTAGHQKYFYRPQEEGSVFTGVCLSTLGLMTTRSLLSLVMGRSVRILLECFLVAYNTLTPLILFYIMDCDSSILSFHITCVIL